MTMSFRLRERSNLFSDLGKSCNKPCRTIHVIVTPAFPLTFMAYEDNEDSQLVAEAKRIPIDPVDYDYSERDIILYNLGIGAKETELQWAFEGHEDFAALPTFGVIPQFKASSGIPLDWLPNYNPVRDQPAKDDITTKTIERYPRQSCCMGNST
jgi:hypothetical protein